MNDSSRSFSGLRDEWSLLVHSVIDDNSVLSEKSEKADLQMFSLEQIKVFNGELSQQKKHLNLKIENIKLRIDHLFTVIENLELVGSNPEDVLNEIESLNIEGQGISTQIAKLDSKLKKIHDLKDRLILISNPS